MTLSYDRHGFSLDGSPHRILSGAAHYFRSRPEQWPHLMRSLAAMGLNTVETYLAWNHHEPVEGEWRRLDEIPRFLDAAAEAGLRSIVRPGPYICAEWDNGGLPSWLTARVGRAIRTSSPVFLDPVKRYLDAVVPLFADHPSVLMVQIENEYGSFGSDADYLADLAAALRERGVGVPLFTSDGPSDVMLTGGAVPGHLATVNFGSGAPAAFDTLRGLRPDDAPMCMEYWCGWFDHWGHGRVTREAEDAAASLREILAQHASVNLYMAHGGTNFGTGAGANHHPEHGGEGYRPTVTSYDYDAPLDERGAPTAKFFAFREEFQRVSDTPLPELPDMPPLAAPQTIRMTREAPVSFRPAGRSPIPLTFEELGIDHGLVRYRTTVPGPRAAEQLTLERLRDRAHVRVDGVLRAIVERAGDDVEIAVTGPSELEVVVESMGRINYGPLIGETKGVDAIRHGRQQLHGFEIDVLPISDDPRPDWAAPAPPADAPRYVGGEFDMPEQADGHLDLSGWSKGYVWVNGFSLGRYWTAAGPQTSLYVPWPILRPGRNEIVILELDGIPSADVPFGPHPGLGARRAS